MIGSETLHGVIPAIPTPFTLDGTSVDEEALRRVVRHVIDAERARDHDDRRDR